MANSKYYSDLFEIEDPYRKRKYHQLLVASLQNDMNKWSEKIRTGGGTTYFSPLYGNSHFVIDILYSGKYIAYIRHSTPVIQGINSELINENFGGELEKLTEKLRTNIYTPEIYELEKLIGSKHSRKEKLDFLEIEQMKELIEDTHQDWLVNSNELNAKMIAKIMYSYRKDEDLYPLWLEKFEDKELIMNELKKIKG